MESAAACDVARASAFSRCAAAAASCSALIAITKFVDEVALRSCDAIACSCCSAPTSSVRGAGDAAAAVTVVPAQRISFWVISCHTLKLGKSTCSSILVVHISGNIALNNISVHHAVQNPKLSA
jgi:hypothetical protein